MSVLNDILKELTKVFGKIGQKITADQFATPPNPDMGDIAFGCFVLAKELKKPAGAIAKELYEKLKPLVVKHKAITNVSVSGPYINFSIDRTVLGEKILAQINKKGDAFGTQKTDKQTVMFEYSQPNTHKAFHIGHMRNAMLGAAIIELYKSQGMKVIAATYVNDIGTHVAKCLWALDKFFAGQIPKTERGRFLGNVYAHASAMLEKNPDWKTQPQELLLKLEAHESETQKRWEETRQWSLDGFAAIYEELGITFDETYFESDVVESGQKTVDELLKKGHARQSDGAIIMDLTECGLDVLVVRKSDGTGLYSTSDLGLAQAKAKKKWDTSMVITDMRQDLYFKQLHKTLELYGFDKPLRHIGYELVRLTTGSMSSRSGTVILYEDFRDEVVESATKETKERHPDWTQKKVKTTAHAIAIAAIKFSMLRVKPSQLITFDKEEALSFNGFSAPYILYTNARIASILKKTKQEKSSESHDFSDPHERELIMTLARYPRAVAFARAQEDPSEICRYAHELARQFSSFYEHCPVKDAEPTVKAGRIALIKGISQTLSNALALLGIATINEM